MSATEKPVHPTQKEFIDYLAPLVVQIQRETGIPASYLLAQAGVESGWGNSLGYSRRNNLFGYSCFKRGAFIMEVPLRSGEVKTVTATCNWPRPEGGFYYSFQNIEDGLWAQVYLLLYSDNADAFSALRDLIRNVPEPQRAKAREVILRLRGYSKGMGSSEYQNMLLQAIGSNHLSRYDYCE